MRSHILLIAFVAFNFDAECLASFAVSSLASLTLPPTDPPYDACRFYQVLSDNRTITDGNQDYTACDDTLFGWYRFMGKAGNRMLDSCPALINNTVANRCGSTFQGWIVSGAMPKDYEGAVTRLVCFSGQHNCTCISQQQILVQNCGRFYVYKLDRVPECSQRYCSVQDTHATVSCGANWMQIELDRKHYDVSLYSSITLRDPECLAVVLPTSLSLGFYPQMCQTRRRETHDDIVYENEVILKARPTSKGVIQEYDQKIAFKCSYNKNGFVSSDAFKPITEIKVDVVGIGKFTFYFRMYKDARFLLPSRYPANVKLRDSLYFEAAADVSDQSLVVLLDQCFLTPTLNRNDPQKNVFINGGRIKTGSVLFMKSAGPKQRFSFPALKYFANSSAFFVHCVVFVCHKTSAQDRCTSGSDGNTVKRIRRGVQEDSAYANPPVVETILTLIEAGPITLEEPAAKQQKETESKISTTVLIMIGGIATLVIIVAILVITRRQRCKAPAQETSEVGIDNAVPGQQYVTSEGDTSEL